MNPATTVDSPAGRVVLAGPLDADLLRGTWHGVLTPLGSSGLFAVVDRVGPGENCEVRHLAQPFAVVERR